MTPLLKRTMARSTASGYARLPTCPPARLPAHREIRGATFMLLHMLHHMLLHILLHHRQWHPTTHTPPFVVEGTGASLTDLVSILLTEPGIPSSNSSLGRDTAGRSSWRQVSAQKRPW